MAIVLQELPRPLTHDEEEKIQIFMGARNIGREAALKFLLGRKFDLKRAHVLLTNYQKVIALNHFETVTVSDVVKELRTGLMYIPGTRDRNDAAILVIDLTKYVPGRFSFVELLRLAFYAGERITESPKTQTTGLTIILDLSGFEWKNFELGLQKRILEFFTDNIPARVKNILVYRPPWWIEALVKLVIPFMKEKMQHRIRICEEGTLTRYAERSQLPVVFGGTLEFDLEAFVKQEAGRMGVEGFRQQLHFNSQSNEITAIPIRIPEGSVRLVDSKTEAMLNEERALALTRIDQRLQILKAELEEEDEAGRGSGDDREAISKGNIQNILENRAKRLSLDLVALQQAQPNEPQTRQKRSNLTDSGTPAKFSMLDDVQNEQVLKARIKADLMAKIGKRRLDAQAVSWKDLPAHLESAISEQDVALPETAQVPQHAAELREDLKRPKVEQPARQSVGGTGGEAEVPDEEESSTQASTMPKKEFSSESPRVSRPRKKTVGRKGEMGRPEAFLSGRDSLEIAEEPLQEEGDITAEPRASGISVVSDATRASLTLEPAKDAESESEGEEPRNTVTKADLLGSGRRRRNISRKSNRAFVIKPEEAGKVSMIQSP